MARPLKNESEKLSERIEFRGMVGTKKLLERLRKYHGKDSIGATVRYLAEEESNRLFPKPPKK